VVFRAVVSLYFLPIVQSVVSASTQIGLRAGQGGQVLARGMQDGL